MNKIMLGKYADLIVKAGVNLQKGQILVISSPVDCADFTREIALVAYKVGAKEVVINWRDDLFSKIRYLHAPEEVFEEYPEWKKEFYVSYSRQGAAFLSIDDDDPEIMKDVDPERIMKSTRTSQTAIKEYRERLMSNRNPWCVVAVPSAAWAKKVFPEVSEEKAVELLWEEIFKTVRVDRPDPAAAWEEHKSRLKKSTDFMNSNSFKLLRYKNSMGTDLSIELPEDHIWIGGSDYTPEGLEFIANIPTEEVFTLPKKTGINGKVVSTKPLSHNGNIIDEFSLTFKDGRIIDFSAAKGYDTLKSIIGTDEGSHFIGEVALVPFDSLTHVDFMIGSQDLEITGVTAEGKEIHVFRNGNFAF